jgi:hypothetical protein
MKKFICPIGETTSSEVVCLNHIESFYKNSSKTGVNCTPVFELKINMTSGRTVSWSYLSIGELSLAYRQLKKEVEE